MTERGVIAAGLVALMVLTGICTWQYGAAGADTKAEEPAAGPVASDSAALSAQWREGRLQLGGVVPDSATKTIVYSRAISRYDPASVDDRIVVGEVKSSRGFDAALAAFPPDLHQLERATVRLTPARFEVEGVARDAQARAAVARGLADVPVGESLLVESRLSVLQPTQPRPETTAPALAMAGDVSSGHGAGASRAAGSMPPELSSGAAKAAPGVASTAATSAAASSAASGSSATSPTTLSQPGNQTSGSAPQTGESTGVTQIARAVVDRSNRTHTATTDAKSAHAFWESRFQQGLAEVVFFQGSARLTPSARGALDRMAARMLAEPVLRFDVVGHSDNRGSADANQRLSTTRAEAVIRHLASRGVDAARLVASGRGATEPVASNDSPAGRWHNRRVEFRAAST